MPKRYKVNEIFRSIQGEGVRAGTVNVFVRFSGCNQHCRRETHGFDCDTQHEAGEWLTLDELTTRCLDAAAVCRWVILTGGEPGLQLDRQCLDRLHASGFLVAIETNGTTDLPLGLDWITVSPKTPEDTLRQLTADEVKYVRADGQPIPETMIQARYKIISPAFDGQAVNTKAVQWCQQLVTENPTWRLGVQIHKLLSIR